MRCVEAVALVFALVQLVSCYDPVNSTPLPVRLDQCAEQSQRDIQCIQSIQNNKHRVSEKISEIHRVKNAMDEIKHRMEELRKVEELSKHTYEHSESSSFLQDDLMIIGWTFNSAHRRVIAITEKLSQLESKMGANIGLSYKVIHKLEEVHRRCSTRKDMAIQAHECWKNMENEPLKSAIQQKIEIFSEVANGKLSSLNQRLLKVGEVCSQVKQHSEDFIDSTEVLSMVQPLSELKDKLQNIVEFFAELEHVVEAEICIPDSINGQEQAVSELFKRLVFPGQEEEELELEEDSKKCYSIADILEEQVTVPEPVVKVVKLIIESVLKRIPDLTLPMPPNFHALYNIDVNGELPDFDQQLNSDAFESLNLLGGDCVAKAKEACETGNEAILESCTSSLTSEGFESSDALSAALVELRDLKFDLELTDKTTPRTSYPKVDLREFTGPEVNTFSPTGQDFLTNGPAVGSEPLAGSESSFNPGPMHGLSGHGGEFGDAIISALHGLSGHGGEFRDAIISALHGVSGHGGEFGDLGGLVSGLDTEFGSSGIIGDVSYGHSPNEPSQTIMSIKDAVRMLNEEQLNRFIVGLKRLVQVLGREKGRRVVEVIHEAVSNRLYELLGQAGISVDAHNESLGFVGGYTNTPYPDSTFYGEEESAEFRPLRSLLDVLTEGGEGHTVKSTTSTPTSPSATSPKSTKSSPVTTTPKSGKTSPITSSSQSTGSTQTTPSSSGSTTHSTTTRPGTTQDTSEVVHEIARYLSELVKRGM